MNYWHKLQISLKPKLPRDLQATEGQSAAEIQVQQQALSHFWAFIKGLLMPTPNSANNSSSAAASATTNGTTDGEEKDEAASTDTPTD